MDWRFARFVTAAVAIGLNACIDTDLPLETTTDVSPQETGVLTAGSDGTQLRIIRGNNQTMLVGCPLQRAVAFRVLDADGLPIARQTITFKTREGATVTPTTARTNRNGVALAYWTLTPAHGVDTLLAEHPSGATAFAVARAYPVAPGGYGTVGNRMYRYDCTEHRFTGVNRPGFQWTSSPNLTAPHFYEISVWQPNVVRLNLSQGFWLQGSASYDPEYPARIDQAIQWAHNVGLDVILDLHYSDRGDLSMPMAMGQRMPDRNSITFWREVANRYKNNGRVMFDLYNEPHDVPWSVWRDGGPSGDGFTAVGMQQLYNAVRRTGAHNVVIVGGLNWGYDLSGLPQYALKGYNIIYSSHPYSYPNKQPDDWPRAFLNAAARYPVILGEFGTYDCSRPYVQQLLDIADQYRLHWTAWAFYIEDGWTLEDICRFPSLIIDWKGTPSPMGEVVRDRLLSY